MRGVGDITDFVSRGINLGIPGPSSDHPGPTPQVGFPPLPGGEGRLASASAKPRDIKTGASDLYWDLCVDDVGISNQRRRAVSLEGGEHVCDAYRSADAASGGLPLAFDFFRILVQVDVVVDLGDPAQRNQVMLTVGAVVLGELDMAPLNVVDLAHELAAG